MVVVAAVAGRVVVVGRDLRAGTREAMAAEAAAGGNLVSFVTQFT